MVQIVENWSEIKGDVRDLRPDPELPGHVVATVELEAANPVEKPEGGTFPNLLAESAGSTVELHVPEAVAAQNSLAPGRRVSARVRRATPTRSFVDPRHISVE
jgi:hypothetical protein